MKTGHCLKPLVCGFVSLDIDQDTPACEFFQPKEEFPAESGNKAPAKAPAATCSDCKFWASTSGP